MAFSFFVEVDINGKRLRFQADSNAVTLDERRAAEYEALNSAYLFIEEEMDKRAGGIPPAEDKDVR